MILEAGICDVTGFTHSLDLEGITFIPPLTSLARNDRIVSLLNVLLQRLELSKKPARRAVDFAGVRRVIRTMAILPGLRV
ncbi:hypothetical protein [Bradyrhizobium betae]|uniref:hypothetical protein n=1 Tax=Bradyrhizobium betae TaxID=244734 RepID=UPI00142EAC91|nr:hypothetical protein [Bradyrhizobium betae]MCS3726453.1 hypothetical protein [Bradyrhizobium betae]